MKSMLAACLIVAWSSMFCVAAESKGIVAKIVGFDGEIEYKAMALDEFTGFEKEIRNESKFFDKALSAAKKEWESGEEEEKGFPNSSVSQRKITKASSIFPTMDKAYDKLIAMQSRKIRSQDEIKEEENKEMEKYKKQHGEKWEKQYKEDQARAAQRLSTQSRARDLFISKLTELLGKPPAGLTPAQNAAQLANQPADKKKEEPKKKEEKKDEQKK